MQCSASAHFCRSDSIGSWRRKFNTQSNWLSIRDTYASVSVQMSAMPYSWGKKGSPFGKKKKKIHEVGGLFLFSFYIRENCHTFFFFSNIKWQSKLSLFVFLNWFCSVKTKIKPSVIMGYINILWFCYGYLINIPPSLPLLLPPPEIHKTKLITPINHHPREIVINCFCIDSSSPVSPSLLSLTAIWFYCVN